MLRKTDGTVEWVEFESLRRAGIPHGVYTRNGGVSHAPWASLNLGGSVGDSHENAIENKKRVLNSFGLAYTSSFDCWLVHSTDYIRAERPRGSDEAHQRADILVTNRPGLVLLMRYADCVPLLAYDPVHQAIAIAHAGWIGTTKDVAGAMIRAMNVEFNTQAVDVIACIGPSIGPDHYQVGSEVVEAVRAQLGEQTSQVISSPGGKTHLDLWTTNEILLKRAGVQQVEVAGICTACHTDDWFSHRAEHGKTGRFGAIIQLPGRD
jgi:polyphenol oxidase